MWPSDLVIEWTHRTQTSLFGMLVNQAETLDALMKAPKSLLDQMIPLSLIHHRQIQKIPSEIADVEQRAGPAVVEVAEDLAVAE
ncbi:hypothetical protein VP1G_11140 [Cytospora mali]|uniref:Uncharacterized protein n=1 Tax=Cytospora mali TaxID=578113 RepID=A0A194V6L4_CYTMA|nr:hypothetical protein VP1G_11140 [Valsa mali var. pyri (nom. inval.)]